MDDASMPNSPGKPLTAEEIQSLPTRLYLDSTIVPILLQGLSLLAEERLDEFFGISIINIVFNQDNQVFTLFTYS